MLTDQRRETSKWGGMSNGTGVEVVIAIAAVAALLDTTTAVVVVFALATNAKWWWMHTVKMCRGGACLSAIWRMRRSGSI